MFGYVITNKPELKIREFVRYKGIYCGLCQSLKEQYGWTGQMTLTYDMTFLVLLLSSLYEPAETQRKKRCLIHPAKKQWMFTSEITKYAADMNILLSYYHFLDDWEDEKNIFGLAGKAAFCRRAQKICEKYPEKAQIIQKQLMELARLEKEQVTDPDVIGRPFGELMAELFCYKQDPFEDILRRFGFFLGKYIYFLDAYMDLEKDHKKDTFNPFFEFEKMPDFPARILAILEGTMRAAIVEFEKLPLEQDVAILRNILYEGVKVELQKKQKKLEKKKDGGQKG
ncbi:MAG: DUF5685 family protein [Eubacterium sp.]